MYVFLELFFICTDSSYRVCIDDSTLSLLASTVFMTVDWSLLLHRTAAAGWGLTQLFFSI